MTIKLMDSSGRIQAEVESDDLAVAALLDVDLGEFALNCRHDRNLWANVEQLELLLCNCGPKHLELCRRLIDRILAATDCR